MLQTQIEQMAVACLQNPAHFLVEVRVQGDARQPKVVVLADGDAGITIEDCAALSRCLSVRLEESGLLDSYRLEVSSPGVDYPLTTLRQFRKNIGRTLQLSLRDGAELTGRLEATDEAIITLTSGASRKAKPVVRQVALADIAQARVLVSFR